MNIFPEIPTASLDAICVFLARLQTETEQSERKGFAQLLKGYFSAIQNSQTHESMATVAGGGGVEVNRSEIILG